MKYYLFEEEQKLPIDFDRALVSYEGEDFEEVQSDFENYLVTDVDKGEIDDGLTYFIYDANEVFVGKITAFIESCTETTFESAEDIEEFQKWKREREVK